MKSELGKPVPFKIGQPFAFPDFILTCTGEKTSNQEPGGPTVTFSKRTFIVEMKDGSRQQFEVTWGQVTPPPVSFTVTKKQYTLFTYETPKGERLFPDRLLITSR